MIQLGKLFGPVALVAIFLSFLAPAASAAPAEGEEHKFDALHHSADGYYLDFLPLGTVELPRLFVVERPDGGVGFEAFGSTAAALRSGRFEVEEVEVEVEERVVAGQYEGDLSADPEHLAPETVEALIESHAHLDAHLVPTEGALILDLSITRHLVFAILAALIVATIFLSLAARYRRGVGRETAPKGIFQNLFEALVVFVRDEIAKPNLGDKYQKFLPYLLTAFFFIFTANLIGLVPFGATATSNLMVTAVLAFCTFLVTQVSASKDYWRHIFWPPGVPAFVKPILVPVEILGIFTKPFALAIRLFANMTAGHLVILSLIGLIFAFTNIFGATAGYSVSPVSLAFALFIYVLELLVAFIQAYIFTMLSALFIGMAVADHHDHEVGHDVLPEGVHDDHGHVTPHTIMDGAGGHTHPQPVVVPTT